jgi:signal transduction histidine kinase
MTKTISERLARNALTNIKLEQPDGTLGEADGRPDYYLGTGPDARFAAQVRVLQPDRSLAVFVPRDNRWASLTVNGQTVRLSDAPAWRGGRLGGKWVVPPAMLRRGDNALVDRWFPDGPRLDRWLVVLVPVVALLILASAMASDPLPAALRAMFELSIVLVANLAIIASVMRGMAIDGARWSLDAAVVLLVPTISLADVIDSLDQDPLTLNSAPLGLFGLAILLLLGIVRRGRMLSLRLKKANLLLEREISAKQAEIEATAQLLRQREAEAAVQSERARIMQDMHDGMSGHLLSVLTQARNPAIPREAIGATVELAIEDLRLMIDSLDSAGDSLDFALGQFRERAEAKLRAAGMELVWRNDLPGAHLILPPGAILAFYRIMQEAINNGVATPAQAGSKSPSDLARMARR